MCYLADESTADIIHHGFRKTLNNGNYTVEDKCSALKTYHVVFMFVSSTVNSKKNLILNFYKNSVNKMKNSWLC